MDPDHFEDLVDQALDGVPPRFAERLENIDVIVRARPSRKTLDRMGLRGHRTLLGLYHGVPQTARTSSYGGILPDRIEIYREPILAEAEALFRSGGQAAEGEGEEKEGEDFEAVVREVVRQTVLHEIGHHFGLSESDLRRLKY